MRTAALAFPPRARDKLSKPVEWRYSKGRDGSEADKCRRAAATNCRNAVRTGSLL
jgi:hypothetical protein